MIGYKITHNTTGSVLVNQTSYSLFPIVGVAPGVYFFSVQAVNVLGDGETESLMVVGMLLPFILTMYLYANNRNFVFILSNN